MTMTKTTYGRYEHGVPQPTESGGWRRADRYFSDNPQPEDHDGQLDRLFAASADDDSPWHATYPPGAYDGERCACCYLGFSHTEDKHRQACRLYGADPNL